MDAEQDVAEAEPEAGQVAAEPQPEAEEGEQHPAIADADADANAALSPFADDDVQVTDAVQDVEAEAEAMDAVLPDRPPTREVRRGSPQTSPGAGEEGAAEMLPGQPDEAVPPIPMPTATVHSTPTTHDPCARSSVPLRQ